jgi:hypothetical protein
MSSCRTMFSGVKLRFCNQVEARTIEEGHAFGQLSAHVRHVRGAGKIEIVQTDRQAHLGKDCCDANHDGKMDSRIAVIFLHAASIRAENEAAGIGRWEATDWP